MRAIHQERERTVSAIERRIRQADLRISPEVGLALADTLADTVFTIASRSLSDLELRSLAEGARGALAFARGVESRLAAVGIEGS